VKKIIFFICAFILLVPTITQAATLCVWQGGSDVANNCQTCASTATACATINHALTQTVTASDTIWASGSLSPFSMGSGDSGASAVDRKSVIRWPGEVRPVIDGGGSGSYGIELNNADHVYIEDFEVKSHASREIWIRAQSSDVLMETMSVNGSAGLGFEIASSFDVELLGPSVLDNDGGGIYVFDPLAVNANGLLIKKGTIATSGSAILTNPGLDIEAFDDVTVKNTYFGQQDQGFIPSLLCDAGSTNINIWNNSFYQNRAEFGTASGSCNNVNFRNNVHTKSDFGAQIAVDANSTESITLNYNDYYNTGSADIGNWAGTSTDTLDGWKYLTSQEADSLNVDPLYSNPTANNMNLQSGSPVIDQGVTIASVLVDHKGISRPQGSGYDMGGYEFQDEEPGIPEFSLFTLMLALFAGLGVLFLVSKINKNQTALK